MRPPVQEPEVTFVEGPNGGEYSKHPAFGQISASRMSGSMNLYGSDFTHNHYIAIRIAASTLKRDLSHDWHHPGKEYIEVYLSEAQWATFVSSLNQGCGPCCTIGTVAGQAMPELPAPKSRADQFSGELDANLVCVVASIRASLAQIDEMKLTKAKAKELKDPLQRALTDLTANLAFVAKSFDEHAEKTVEKAKSEVHGYMTSVLMRAGVLAIQNGQLPLAIEQQSAAEHET